MLNFVNALIEKENIWSEFFNSIAEIVGIISILIYLELIELRFLNLNRDLKKNIELRALTEYRSSELDEDEQQ